MINASEPSCGRQASAPAFNSKLTTIWLVGGHDNYRQLQANSINIEKGVFCARLYPSVAGMLVALKHQMTPDIILINVGMPERFGFKSIESVRRLAPKACVIVIGGFGKISQLKRRLSKKHRFF